MSATDTSQSEWKSTRFWLAIGVTVTSIASVGTLAISIIHHAIDKSDTGMRVLGSVLPLLGTWVGTVLAYYFSKENFEAATKSVTELAKQITPQEKLKSTPVAKVMISRREMFVESGSTSELKLSKVLDDLEKAKKGDRVPILDANDRVQCILHRSIIDRYLAGEARSGRSAAEIAALTISDLLKVADLKSLASAYGVIKLDSTLSDVAEVMNKIEHCQDVFVTQSGAKDESILGWVTNAIIQENAEV
jgi:hypothetical protein